MIAHDNHDHDIDHKVSKFIDDMVTEHQFSEEYLRALIGEAKKKDGILNAFTKPATSKPWSFFRKLYVTEWREKEGVKFWNKHSETLARAEEVFGIPQDIITALIGIETNYGTYTGEFRILENGKVFEKVGINFSEVYGKFSKKFAKKNDRHHLTVEASKNISQILNERVGQTIINLK